MKLFNFKNKIVYFSFGSISGSYMNSKRYVVNCREVEVKSHFVIGKSTTKAHPLYGDMDVTMYICFFIRLAIAKKGKQWTKQ